MVPLFCYLEWKLHSQVLIAGTGEYQRVLTLWGLAHNMTGPTAK